MNEIVLEGPVVGPEGVCHQQVLIREGRVAAKGDLGLRAHRRWSDSHLIYPGFGDVHVHLREGQEYKEDFVTGSQAALNGGVTFCCDMPNNPIPPIDSDTLARKKAKLPSGPVHIELYAALGPGTKPFGAKRYKGFLAHSTGPLYFSSLDEAGQVVADYAGELITFHCEDPEILDRAQGAPNHEESRPNQAEVAAVREVLKWVDRYGIRANIAHVSTEGALQLLLERNDVTFEVTPHHLYFDTVNRPSFQRGSLLKMNPPLRQPQDRQALMTAFKQGRIPLLATDHAPHTLAEKLSENSPSGVPLLDTYGVFVCWLLIECGVEPRVIYQACCANPARFLELPDRGHLEPGARADLVVLDLSSTHTVKTSDLATRCGWSPFEGVTFPGSVDFVMVSGQAVRDRKKTESLS